MKKNIFKLGILTAAILLFASCTKEDSDSQMPNLAQLQADAEALSNTAASNGVWTITKFIDSGKNETNDFLNYGFTFNPDGSLVADNGNTTVTGTWSVTIDDDSSDDNDDDSNDDSNDDNSSGDDSDDDCNNCTVNQLTEVITSCSDWFVDKLVLNDDDFEDSYTGYRFNFTADGGITVTAGTDSFSGTWQASGAGNNIQVVISVPNLSDFEATWTLHEIELYNGESKVDLRINGDDRLRFKNSCTIGNFNGGSSSGEIDFNIFFASPADFSELTEDWNVISHTMNKIELIHVSGGNGGTDLLTFEK